MAERGLKTLVFLTKHPLLLGCQSCPNGLWTAASDTPPAQWPCSGDPRPSPPSAFCPDSPDGPGIHSQLRGSRARGGTWEGCPARPRLTLTAK